MFSRLKSKPDATFFSAGQCSDTVKGYEYQIVIFEGMMDYVHGRGYHATEIYIPSHKVIFNSECYVFSGDKPRNTTNDGFNTTIAPLKEVNISKSLVDRLARMALIEAETKDARKNLKSDDEFALLFDKTKNTDHQDNVFVALDEEETSLQTSPK